VESAEAEALVVAKLDRLSRSMADFTRLMERSWKKGWALVALDLGVDTTTPAGEMIANSVANFSQFERRLIGQRTKDALAVKKSQGVQLGRPRVMPERVVRRIERMRTKGESYRGIAEALNAAGVPTAHGGARWHASTVRKVLWRGSVVEARTTSDCRERAPSGHSGALADGSDRRASDLSAGLATEVASAACSRCVGPPGDCFLGRSGG
jgi:hypothetical protein